MPKEIERKYLIDLKKWGEVIKPPGQHYRQGYLSADPKTTIRVRLTDTNGFLTIKGLSVGATRSEYEYEIPVADAKELLDNFSVSELSKIRYKIKFGNHLWEVDEFLGDNAMNTQVKFENITYNQESEDFVATFSYIGKTFQLTLLDFNEGDGDAALSSWKGFRHFPMEVSRSILQTTIFFGGTPSLLTLTRIIK